jgi:hypothetical protein
MFVREARALCPDLICLPCEYDKYEKVSQQIYQIFLKYSNRVQVTLYPSAGCAQSTKRSRGVGQAVSADEAFLDLSAYSDPEDIIAKLRYIDCPPAFPSFRVAASQFHFLASMLPHQARHLRPDRLPGQCRHLYSQSSALGALNSLVTLSLCSPQPPPGAAGHGEGETGRTVLLEGRPGEPRLRAALYVLLGDG